MPTAGCCLRIGSWIVIRHVLDEYHLSEMLYKPLGKSTGLFLDLVSFSIIDQDNAGQYYPDFAFCHPLFTDQMKIYSDVTVSRLLSTVSREQIITFLDDWNAGRDKKQRIYVSYDSTNKNCQAGDIDLVEFGKAKDDKGIPVFNVSIAFDKTNRVPLFYEEYPGSITDVSQFRCMVDKVIEYGYKKIGFILDRGYFSKENIQYMDENQYSFIIMAKGCKSLVASMVDSIRNTFETDRKCLIRTYKVYGTTITSRLYEDDTDNRYFHIFYNPSRQAAEREKLEQKIERYHEFLDQHIGSDTQFGKTYQDYFNLYYKGMLWSSFFVTLVAKKIVLINLCCRPCFIWGSITIITVWTNMIIINVCKFFYLLIECFLCCKLIQICAFILQGIEITLHRCIVVRISCFAHALCHIYRFAEFGKCFGRIL